MQTKTSLFPLHPLKKIMIQILYWGIRT